MCGDDVEAEIIARRDDRRDKRAKVVAERNKVKAEEGPESSTEPQCLSASSCSNGRQPQPQAETTNTKRTVGSGRTPQSHVWDDVEAETIARRQKG